ncbi:MAG: DeoR/GlpR family DNA-binding transcription regulator [Verrucomicrobia bacterium]|nr:DeoR/GlpR family DNA-binding transcription regulator [Verrucomicrobiota bacterium]
MFAQERHNSIRKVVRERQRLSFAELQKLFSISPATLRRDLSELENSGDLIRVHGGVLDPLYARAEISFDERQQRRKVKKQSIASIANELIPGGSSVFVDAGSTCLEAGKVLMRRADIRLITHSVALIAACSHAEATIICIGGELRKVSGALVGGNALNAFANLQFDFALIGATGLNSEGCWTTEFTESEVKKNIITRAKRRIVLADQSKWQAPGTVLFSAWEKINDWVVDHLPKDAAQAIPKSVCVHHPIR